MLSVANLHKYYQDVHVLKGINLAVQQQEIVVIIGASDAGKSTLLRCLNFVEVMDEGEIWFTGRKLDTMQEDIGMVFQHVNLFPHKTVLENVLGTRSIRLQQGRENTTNTGIDILEKVGLKDKAYVYPNKLSSSQIRRVATARALAKQPKLMLFDDPTALPDTGFATEIIAVIKLLKKSGMAMVITTSDLHFAADIADRILFLENGVILEESRADAFFKQPKTAPAQSLVKDMKLK